MRKWLCLALILTAAAMAAAARAGEERIRGTLEKTVKPGACAQITDALAEVYFINKTEEAEKLVAGFLGKNERVVITGTVEQKEGDPSYFFALKSVEPYAPKLPPAPAAEPKAPSPAPAPAPDTKAAPPAPAPAPDVKKDEKAEEKK